MQIVASLLFVAAIVSGAVDWSKVTIEPPMVPTPTAAGLNLSSIVLDGPGPLAVGLDWSNVTLEPPGSYTPAAGQLDWSTVPLEGTATPVTAGPRQE